MFIGNVRICEGQRKGEMLAAHKTLNRRPKQSSNGACHDHDRISQEDRKPWGQGDKKNYATFIFKTNLTKWGWRVGCMVGFCSISIPSTLNHAERVRLSSACLKVANPKINGRNYINVRTTMMTRLMVSWQEKFLETIYRTVLSHLNRKRNASKKLDTRYGKDF